jgi:GNAT superfamily N-acetyltransferase
MNVKLSHLDKDDLDQLPEFLEEIISDSFKQDGIVDKFGEQEEIQKQLERMKESIESGGKSPFFLVARIGDRVVGVIAYCKPNQLIQDNLKVDLSGVPEITSVLVHPDFQGQGIGSLLFRSMVDILEEEGFHHFCLDGGYKKSQGFWKKKLGEPDVVLEDYYGYGLPYMIWYRKIDEVG